MLYKRYAVCVLLSILLSHNAVIQATLVCAPDGTPYDPTNRAQQKNVEYAASYCTPETVGFTASMDNSTEPERRNDDIATFNASPTSSTSRISSGRIQKYDRPTFNLHYRLAGDDIFGYGAGAYAPENQPDNHGDIARKYWGP
jgi:hypothetical protein